MVKNQKLRKRGKNVAVRKRGSAAIKKKEMSDRMFVFRLFVSGSTPRSLHAIRAVQAYCDHHLKGLYTLEVIDIYQSPQQAINENIVAVPTLVKKHPEPLRKYIGDLQDLDGFTPSVQVPS